MAPNQLQNITNKIQMHPRTVSIATTMHVMEMFQFLGEIFN